MHFGFFSNRVYKPKDFDIGNDDIEIFYSNCREMFTFKLVYLNGNNAAEGANNFKSNSQGK